jgi:hypothetical protein
MPFNEIPLLYRLRMLYENPEVFFAKAIPTSDLLNAISIKDVKASQLTILDSFIAKFGEEKLKIELIKKYLESNIFMQETVRSLSIE